MDLVPAGGIVRDRVFGKSEIEIVVAGSHENDAIGAADF